MKKDNKAIRRAPPAQLPASPFAQAADIPLDALFDAAAEKMAVKKPSATARKKNPQPKKK